MDYIRFYNARASSTGDLASLTDSILVPSEDEPVIASDSTDSILVPEMKKSQSVTISTLVDKPIDKCTVIPVSFVLNENVLPSPTRLSIRMMEADKPEYIFHLLKQHNKRLKFIETTPNEYNTEAGTIVLRGFESVKDSRWTYIHYAEGQMRCTLKPQLRALKHMYLNEFTSPYVSINFSYVTSFNGIFSSMSRLEDMTIENFDTKRITSMEEAFMDCVNLKSIMFIGCDFSSVQTMANFCRGCRALKSIRFMNCKLNIRCDYWYAFHDCPLLETIRVPEEVQTFVLSGTPELHTRTIRFD